VTQILTTATAADVRKHLETCKTHALRRCRMTFTHGVDRQQQPKTQTLEGCFYRQSEDRVGINLVGVPDCYIKELGHTFNGDTQLIKRTAKVCFAMPDIGQIGGCQSIDACDWYVATYYIASKKGDPPFQPFGANSILLPWTVDEAIDLYADKPYERVAVTIEWLED
jgi:hypothetical protein